MSGEPRPSGLLAGQTDPAARGVLQRIGERLRAQYGDPASQAPAAVPQRAGEATAAGRSAVATPGTPPVVPRDGDGVPGPASPSLPVDRPGSGGEAQTSRPGRAAQDAASGTGSKAWRKALADHHKAQRNRRGKR